MNKLSEYLADVGILGQSVYNLLARGFCVIDIAATLNLNEQSVIAYFKKLSEYGIIFKSPIDRKYYLRRRIDEQ